MICNRTFMLLSIACATLAFLGLSPQAQAQGVVEEWAAIPTPSAPPVKAVIIDPGTSALLVMDFNQGTCTAAARPRCVASIPKVKALIEKARASHTLVVYTGIPDMKPYMAEIAPKSDDPMVVARANKFTGTELDNILKDHGIKTVILAGVVGNGAVLFTAFGAFEHGYKVVVPADTMPAESAYAEQNAIWGLLNDPGLGPVTTLTSVDMLLFH